jgi:hypothetical protein
MAFVVITHLHPEHESHMAELLQRHTKMHTMQVNNSEMAGRYLHLPKGPITGDLLTLVRPELRTALFRAFEKGKGTASRAVAVQFNGHKRRVVVALPRIST